MRGSGSRKVGDVTRQPLNANVKCEFDKWKG
jgi:hypothetical protein